MADIPKDKLPIPTGWNTDDLSDFIHRSMYNVLATFDSKKEEYSLIRDIDSIFQKVIDNLINTPDFLPSMLFLRTHSAYRAACRLSMSGQVPETFALLRSCIENSLYALHMFKHKEKQDVWLDRHENEQSLKETKKEFKVVTVMKTLETFEPSLCKITKELYDNTIDWGAHPNERAMSSCLKIIKGETQTAYKQIYLSSDATQLSFGLNSTATTGVCCLYIFRYIFKERFALTGVTESLKKYKNRLIQ